MHYAPHVALGAMYRPLQGLWRRFLSVFATMPYICKAVVLLFLQQSAHAGLWLYQDASGVTYLSNQSSDTRFKPAHGGSAAHIGQAGSVPGLWVAAQAPGVPRSRALSMAESAQWFQPLKPLLQGAAQRHGVDYNLLKALIAAESAFNPAAVSPKGAVGLMQVMPATASRFGVAAEGGQSIAQKLADPAVNVPAGTRYLRYLMDMFPGRTDLVLAAYNAGEGAVKRHGNQIPPYKETQNYVRTVMAFYTQLAGQSAGALAGLPALDSAVPPALPGFVTPAPLPSTPTAQPAGAASSTPATPVKAAAPASSVSTASAAPLPATGAVPVNPQQRPVVSPRGVQMIVGGSAGATTSTPASLPASNLFEVSPRP